MSKNINTNTAIAQIILSKDHEIRLKKKPKKKSSGAKKKALEDVKEQLRNYDLAINQAKSKNVTLPSELGILPVQIDDVNSVKELQALSIKLQSMTNQINQLIVKGASQQRTIGLFQEQIGGQRQGFLPPVVQPRIIEPQQISPEKSIPIRPVRPELVDPSKKPIDDTNAEKTLEQIRQEILDKLSPEDRKNAQAEIDKQKEPEDELPATLPDIVLPTEMKDSDFETNLGIEFGNKRINLKSPVGFYDLLTRYRRYVKAIMFDTIQITTGEYKIEKDKYRSLENEKKIILKDYYVWLSNLNLSQTNYMDNNSELLKIDNAMIFDLNENPEDLAKRTLNAEGVDIKEFKVGDQETSLEKTLETKITNKGIEYRTRMNQQIDQINKIILDSNKTVKPNELTDLQNQLNLIRVDVDKYNSLEPVDKVGLEIKHAQLEDMLNETFKQIQNKEQEISQGLPFIPSPELKPSDPVEFQPPSPKPRQEAESQPPSPKADLIDTQALKTVIQYINNTSKTYSDSVRRALLKLPNSKLTYDQNLKIQNRSSFKKDIAKDIKENTLRFLKNEGLIDEDKKPSA